MYLLDDRVSRVRLALVLATLALAGCGRQSGSQQASAGAPVPVTVVTLHARPVELTRELPGRTSAFRIAEVRPQVSGIIKRRLFQEGTFVKAGQALYQLDDATYRADYGVKKAALSRAEAGLEVAKLRATRAGELAARGLVSKQDNDDAIAALHQAQADVESSRASLQAASVVLDYARITSPIAGRIGKSSFTEGALVTAEQSESLATVQEFDTMYVDLTQSSAELLELRKLLGSGSLKESGSMPVAILLEDGTRYPHDGTLEYSDVTVDPTTGSYLLRVKVPNPEHSLLPGMYVRARVGSGVRPDGLLVPQQAIARDPTGQASAYVVGQDGKVELRDVSVTRTVGDRWLVDSGLAAGDRVVIAGLQKIRPGAPVQATEAPAAGPSTAPSAGTQP